MYHRSVFIHTIFKIVDIDDWEVTLFEKCQTHKQLKEKEMFWQHNVHLTLCLFIYLFIYLFIIYLFIYLFIYNNKT